jgi:hypothetical protein
MLGKVGVVGVGLAVVACEDEDVVPALVVLVDLVVGVAADVAGHVVAPLTPTQYDSPTQKFWLQSALTAGFHARNWSRVIPNLVAMEGQVSPETIV